MNGTFGNCQLDQSCDSCPQDNFVWNWRDSSSAFHSRLDGPLNTFSAPFASLATNELTDSLYGVDIVAEFFDTSGNESHIGDIQVIGNQYSRGESIPEPFLHALTNKLYPLKASCPLPTTSTPLRTLT